MGKGRAFQTVYQPFLAYNFACCLFGLSLQLRIFWSGQAILLDQAYRREVLLQVPLRADIPLSLTIAERPKPVRHFLQWPGANHKPVQILQDHLPCLNARKKRNIGGLRREGVLPADQ